MGRTTIKELQGIIDNLNASLKRRGIEKELHLGLRYGHKAIDIYKPNSYQLIDTLATGMTIGEVEQYLRAMEKARDLFRKPKKK